jgi:hypothetical protein
MVVSLTGWLSRATLEFGLSIDGTPAKSLDKSR